MWPLSLLRRARRGQSPTGARGEKLAEKFLRKAGLRILGVNYRCPAGEADIVALDSRGGAVVFVEVKTRSSDDYVAPQSAVDAEKQRRLRAVARYYAAGRQLGELRIRFDVVAVVLNEGQPPRITHLPGAFE
jgi:putative endonuclease